MAKLVHELCLIALLACSSIFANGHRYPDEPVSYFGSYVDEPKPVARDRIQPSIRPGETRASSDEAEGIRFPSSRSFDDIEFIVTSRPILVRTVAEAPIFVPGEIVDTKTTPLHSRRQSNHEVPEFGFFEKDVNVNFKPSPTTKKNPPNGSLEGCEKAKSDEVTLNIEAGKLQSDGVVALGDTSVFSEKITDVEQRPLSFRGLNAVDSGSGGPTNSKSKGEAGPGNRKMAAEDPPKPSGEGGKTTSTTTSTTSTTTTSTTSTTTTSTTSSTTGPTTPVSSSSFSQLSISLAAIVTALAVLSN